MYANEHTWQGRGERGMAPGLWDIRSVISGEKFFLGFDDEVANVIITVRGKVSLSC